MFEYLKELFKFNSKEETIERDDEIGVENHKELSPFFLILDDYTEFKLYMDIENKTYLLYLDDDFVNMVFKKFSSINLNVKNKELIEAVVEAFLQACKNDIKHIKKYKDGSIHINDNELKVFLEPTSLYNCEIDIFNITDIVYDNFKKLLINLEGLNNMLREHLETSAKLDETKKAVLQRIINKQNKKRKVL